MFHPDYPVVEDHHQLTREWSVNLPVKFSRRIEEGSLVLWRTEPRLTIWMDIWRNEDNTSQEEMLSDIKARISKDAMDTKISKNEGQILFSYRLNETEENLDDRTTAYYGFEIGDSGHVSMAIYFDKESDLQIAEAVFQSLYEIKP